MTQPQTQTAYAAMAFLKSRMSSGRCIREPLADLHAALVPFHVAESEAPAPQSEPLDAQAIYDDDPARLVGADEAPDPDPNTSVTYGDDGELDEISTDDAHLERMSKKWWFLIMKNADGSSVAVRIKGKVVSFEEREASQPPPPVDMDVVRAAAEAPIVPQDSDVRDTFAHYSDRGERFNEYAAALK